MRLRLNSVREKELAAKRTKEEKEAQLLADRHDQFAQEYPQAALAIYVREVETRILAVVGQLILDKGGDPVAAYSNARKGQQLSVLESKAHDLKSVLRSKNYPCLAQKSLVGFVKKICVQAGHYSSRARSTSKSSKRSSSGSRSNRQRSKSSKNGPKTSPRDGRGQSRRM